ncbi:hypothetical protein ELH41_16215 [Rhizobium ruizarguesonis]|nr:hypothetical protein ELH41_16215 [Rhizobium ruizarguesonis]
MMPMAEKIPAHLEPYVLALGEDKAIEFFLRFGGAQIYLSENPQPSSEAAQVIGIEGVRALARALRSGHILRVPLAKEWTANRLKAKGWKVQAIARELRATDVTVRKWLKAREDRQLTLFDLMKAADQG